MSAVVLADFCRQLAVLLDAGMSVLRCLETLTRQGRRASRRLSASLVRDISRGLTLAEAAGARPGVFSPLHINLIRAGEQSGRLPETLEKLADSMDAVIRLKRRLIAGLLYPVIVLHLLALVMTAMKTFVKFTANGLQTGFYLTEGLLFALYCLGPVYGLVIAIRILIRLGRHYWVIRFCLDALSWRLPLFGKLQRHLALARFARALEGLYAAGINMTQAVRMAAEAAGNEVFKRKISDKASSAVARGEDLAHALAATGAFEIDTISLLATGVESGRLDGMLLKIAEKAEHDAQARSKIISIVLPLLVFLLIVLPLFIYFIFTIFYKGYIQPILHELNG